MEEPMRRRFIRLRKTGNSLVITIPKQIAETLGWKEGDELFMEVKETAGTQSFFPREVEHILLQIVKTKT